MSSLQNLQISQTFPGLIKTNDELALSGTLSTLQDGAGNNTGLQLSSNAGNYGTVITSDETYTNGLSVLSTGTFIGGTVDFQTSTVDFANATVTGLPDTNTTYDYGAVGAAGNINMALTGSDATNDVVTMQAGTNITLTDNGSNTFTIDAAGGGGGGMEATLYTTGRGVNMVPGSTSSGDLWRTTYVPDTYGTSTTNINNEQMKVVAMGLIEGQTVDSFGVHIRTATTTGVITAALYKTIIGSDGNIAGGALEYNFGTIDATTTGLKVINGAGHTLGATTDNTYFLAIWNGSGSTVGVLTVGSTNLSGMLSHMSMYATTAYRGTTYAQNFASLPATLGITSWNKRTDFPVYGLKFS